MEEITKNSNLDLIDYSLRNCMLWGVSRSHFGKVSVAWKDEKYTIFFKHLFIGILEAIPVFGQILSLAERQFTLIQQRTDVRKKNLYFKNKAIVALKNLSMLLGDSRFIHYMGDEQVEYILIPGKKKGIINKHYNELIIKSSALKIQDRLQAVKNGLETNFDDLSDPEKCFLEHIAAHNQVQFTKLYLESLG